MKRITFDIAMNPRHYQFDPDNPTKPVTGYRHSEFIGIYKTWTDSWEITHLPTGALMLSGIDKRKNAVAIADEIEGAIGQLLGCSDFDKLKAQIPDDLASYIGFGLQGRLGAFEFQTFAQFKEYW